MNCKEPYQEAGAGGRTDFGYRIQTAKQLSKLIGFNYRDIDSINDFLKNEDRLSLDEFYSQFKKMAQALRVRPSKDYLSSVYRHTFVYGHLNASDAATNSKYYMETIEHTMALLERWPRPEIVKNLIQSNPSLFEGSTSFQKFLGGLLNGELQNLTKLQWLLDMGMNPSQPFKILQSFS